MTPREVAKLFGVEPETVVDWANARPTPKLPSTRTPGGRHRFRPAVVDAALADQAELMASDADAPMAVSA